MKKKIYNGISSFVFGGIGIFCIVYYSSKFYINGNLSFEHNLLLCFTIISTMIIIALIMGMVLYVKLVKLECENKILQKQNEELLSKVSTLSKNVDEYHYSQLSAIENNMECILDLDNMEDK